MINSVHSYITYCSKCHPGDAVISLSRAGGGGRGLISQSDAGRKTYNYRNRPRPSVPSQALFPFFRRRVAALALPPRQAASEGGGGGGGGEEINICRNCSARQRSFKQYSSSPPPSSSSRLACCLPTWSTGVRLPCRVHPSAVSRFQFAFFFSSWRNRQIVQTWGEFVVIVGSLWWRSLLRQPPREGENRNIGKARSLKLYLLLFVYDSTDVKCTRKKLPTE